MIFSCAEVTDVGVASVMLTVKGNSPVASGIPDICPVAGFKTNPGGSGPLPKVHT